MAVTLREIEQETARRCGPFRLFRAASGTVTVVVVAQIRSQLQQGGYKGMFLLRRGRKSDGSAVVGFDANDRQRLVKEYEAQTGELEPDDPWAVAPVADEEIELHLLDPEQELRPAVLAGLKKCYFVDRAALTLAGAAPEYNLTALASWLTDPAQLHEVAVAAVGATTPPSILDWSRPFTRAGQLWLQASPDPFPNTLYVTARRSHFTWVNGATSTTGPTADSDTLEVPLDYAAAAAHTEAWRIAPERLRPVAEAGLRLPLEAAADVFTKEAAANVRRRRRRVAFSQPYRAVPRW